MPTAAKIASSSVGGSRRTRRVPYFVFQSSLIKCLASSAGSDRIRTCCSRLCLDPLLHANRQPPRSKTLSPPRYVRMPMLHCNMKLEWQHSHASTSSLTCERGTADIGEVGLLLW